MGNIVRGLLQIFGATYHVRDPNVLYMLQILTNQLIALVKKRPPLTAYGAMSFDGTMTSESRGRWRKSNFMLRTQRTRSTY